MSCATPPLQSEKATDVAFVKNVAIIFYRSSIVWPQQDIDYLREQGILVIKSEKLCADVHIRDLTTYQASGPDISLSLIHKAALMTVGYNTEVFARKVLELARAEIK